MWKQTRTEDTPVAAAPAAAATVTAPTPATSVASVASVSGPAPTSAAQPAQKEPTASIGKSVVITGDVSGTEDLYVDGRVDGRIDVSGQILTIGPNAVINGPLTAREVLVMGAVHGDVKASAKVTMHKHGTLEGSIDAPTVSIAEGATVQGRIDTHSSRRKQQSADLAIAV